MKNFARISLSLVMLAGLAGVATAGDGSAAKPAAPAPTATKTPAPAADKAPAPAPTADKKAEAMAMPKPAPEIATAAKAMAGTWKCDGITMGGADMKTEIKTKGTWKSKVDLDGFWINTTFAETKKGGFKLSEYSSFDATSKKWNRLMVDNMGSHEISSSTGMSGTKMTWEGTGSGMGMTMKSRHTEEVVSAKEIKIAGEYSMDNGKTYMKMYDMTCKK